MYICFVHTLKRVNVCADVCVVCVRIYVCNGKNKFVLHIPFFILPFKMLLVGGWFLICGLWGILFVSEFLPFYKGHSMSNYGRKFTTILQHWFFDKNCFYLSILYSEKLCDGSLFLLRENQMWKNTKWNY